MTPNPTNASPTTVMIREPNEVSRYLARGDYVHITKEEYEKLLLGATDPESRVLLDLLWTTGCRISEGLSLRAFDLHRDVSGQYSLNIERLKRRRPVRQVLPIPNELGYKIDTLIKLKQITGETRLFDISRSAVWRRLQKLGRMTLGREISPKMFRHGRAYHLVKKGKHPLILAKVLGHLVYQTSMNYYHPHDDDLRDAMTD